MKKTNRPNWKGGPPDYMWWIVVLTQIVQIIVNVILAVKKMA